MHRSILAGVLAAAALALTACGAPLPPPRPLAGGPSAAPDPDQQVTSQDERTTGTNMSRSVCLTKEQVDENHRAAQDWEKHPRRHRRRMRTPSRRRWTSGSRTSSVRK